MVKPVVMASLEDSSGARCVDLLCRAGCDWSWVECRRDPEDAHGWRRLHGAPMVWFGSREAALADAKTAVPWLASG